MLDGEFTAQEIPKVLDCGPIGDNCNLGEGGEYYKSPQQFL